MGALIVLIGLIAFPLTWWLLNRSAKQAGWKPFTRHIAGAGCGFVFMIGIIGLFATPPEATNDAKGDVSEHIDANSNSPETGNHVAQAKGEPAVRDENVNDTPVTTLDFTPQQYVDRFNANLRKAKLPFRAKVKIVDGSLKTMLSDRHALIGLVDEDSGRLKDVILIAQGDGSAASGADVFMVGVSALAAAIPEAEIDDGIGKVTLDLFGEAMDTGKSATAIRNDVKLMVSQGETTGTWFGASPME